VDELRIANCSGFYGDRFSALREVVTGGPVDVVTGDYLAELTMLILFRSRVKDPDKGYATTFLRQIEPVLGEVVDRGIKVVVTAGGLAAGKAVYDDLKQQLGATEQDLADAEKALEEAGAQQEQAEKDAEAAKKKAEQAGNETEKAQAEAEQAKADTKAAESKTKIAGECARAYVAAIGVLFEGDDPSANADDVRKQVEAITDECRAALGGS
jgi:hypothetical protein